MSDSGPCKGDELLQQAESKARGASGGGGGFFSFLGGSRSSKTEEASELYVRAANAFKMNKQWAKAGEAFAKSAHLQLGKSSQHDAATHFVDAANCFRKVDTKRAVDSLKAAIDIYTDMGRFTIAAKHHMSIGEIYEGDSQSPTDSKLAAEQYEKAADYYRGEESNASASKCTAKVAHLSALSGDYVKAAGLFEELGKTAMESSLLKYGAKDHFFKACLCHFNIDVLNCEQALRRYAELNPSFTDSREYKLLVKLVESANPEEPNVEAFTEAVADYDSISRFEPWTVTMLNNVKKVLKDDEPELA